MFAIRFSFFVIRIYGLVLYARFHYLSHHLNIYFKMALYFRAFYYISHCYLGHKGRSF